MMIDSTGSLTIYSLKTTDRGLYICEVINEVGQAKQLFRVDVYGKTMKFSFQLKRLRFFLL